MLQVTMSCYETPNLRLSTKYKKHQLINTALKSTQQKRTILMDREKEYNESWSFYDSNLCH